MIVSWKWLRQYVELDCSVTEAVERLTMSGLNLESCEASGDDWTIDLEVTSNRADCLGHVGVARELAALYEHKLNIPPALVLNEGSPASAVTSVKIDCPDLCPQYSARIIEGVRVGPSPAWLEERLRAVGITPINNVVDVTNFVVMECGQPLHAFDFDKLKGREIIVRRAKAGERLLAINHKECPLTSDMCVIADQVQPVALAGVMGGASTEIGPQTKNVLIEVANFRPQSIRSTARKLSLHSDSSYRFERGVDPMQLDWASRRCCELILQTGGGSVRAGAVLAGAGPAWNPDPITLRLKQIHRVLGIEISPGEVVRILQSLGLTQVKSTGPGEHVWLPPSFRRDLTREIDLIEEVARIHGYHHIPETATIPVVPGLPSLNDRVLERIRQLFTGAGLYEAVTLSLVSEEQIELFRPHRDTNAIAVDHPSFQKLSTLRQSLVPSLLSSRLENERNGVAIAELFEIATVYLRPVPGEADAEPRMLGFVSGRSFLELKGLLESVAEWIAGENRVHCRPCHLDQFEPGRGAEVRLGDKLWGWLGELSRGTADKIGLRDDVVVGELYLQPLLDQARLTPMAQPLPQFPASTRDLNFVLDDATTWEQLEQVVRKSGGAILETVQFAEQYRGKQIPVGKKSYVLSLSYRAADRTLTNEEVERSQQAIIGACQQELAAILR